MFADGNWAIWSEWGSCSVTCGVGNQTRTRTCTDPTPANGGMNCSETNVEIDTQTCSGDPCPVGNILSSEPNAFMKSYI